MKCWWPFCKQPYMKCVMPLFVGAMLSMNGLDHLKTDIHPSVMHETLFLQYMWLSNLRECISYWKWHFVFFHAPLVTRQLKIPHIVFSSESADQALNQVQQKVSKHQWMLSGKPREVEPPAPKQRLALTPVLLPKLGYIQITVTEVEPMCVVELG